MLEMVRDQNALRWARSRDAYALKRLERLSLRPAEGVYSIDIDSHKIFLQISFFLLTSSKNDTIIRGVGSTKPGPLPPVNMKVKGGV